MCPYSLPHRPDFASLATHRGRNTRHLIIVRADGLAYSERGWSTWTPEARAADGTLHWNDGRSEPLERVISEAELHARGLA